jgi:hypothetical protein
MRPMPVIIMDVGREPSGAFAAGGVSAAVGPLSDKGLESLEPEIKTTEPNQSLQTMTFAVTLAPSHPSRQRRSRLI